MIRSNSSAISRVACGAADVGERARNEILEEVIGFANAHGGDIVIGVGETTDKPPRAASVHRASSSVNGTLF
jgi:predicted HTH transcriptional regulator